jgi:peroxiredoxin
LNSSSSGISLHNTPGCNRTICEYSVRRIGFDAAFALRIQQSRRNLSPVEGFDEAKTVKVAEYSLTKALEERPVLLNFYVFNFHPACRENVCALHTLSWFDLDEGVTVYGISTDSVHSHREFARQETLGFPLLSDSDGSVAASYDVLADEIERHRQVAQRSVFLIDRSGTVRYTWSGETPSQQPDWEEIKRATDLFKPS